LGRYNHKSSSVLLVYRFIYPFSDRCKGIEGLLAYVNARQTPHTLEIQDYVLVVVCLCQHGDTQKFDYFRFRHQFRETLTQVVRCFSHLKTAWRKALKRGPGGACLRAVKSV
jgi:hypothetical protein